MRIRPGLPQRRSELRELAEQRPGSAGVDDLLDPECLRGAERRAELLQPLLDLDHLRGRVGRALDVGAVRGLDAALERQRPPAPRGPRVARAVAGARLVGPAGPPDTRGGEARAPR